MSGNSLCSLCHFNPAAEMCCCSYPPVLVCPQCESLHRDGNEGIHYFIPIACMEGIHSSDELFIAREHLRRIKTAERWMRASAEEIRKCEEAILAAKAEAIRHLSESVDERLSALHALESSLLSSISSSCSELLSHIHEPEYSPASDLSRTLWNFSNSSDPAVFELFKWKVSVQHQDTEVRVNISFWTLLPDLAPMERKRVLDIACPHPQVEVIGCSDNLEAGYTEAVHNTSQIVFVMEEFMKYYDCSVNTWSAKVAFKSPIHADDKSAYCILDNFSVLCTGGGSEPIPWSTVYLISSSGIVRELKSLTKPRRRHALFVFRGFAYAFGGWSGIREKSGEKMKVSRSNENKEWMRVPEEIMKVSQSMESKEWMIVAEEKMKFGRSMENQEWVRVSDMLEERSSFNPCEHKELIYMCGGAGCISGEAYEPIEELHIRLDFELPDQSETFCTVKDGMLIIVSKENACTWTFERKFRVFPDEHTNVWGSMTPLLIDKYVYLPYLLPDKAFVERFDLANMEVTKDYLSDDE